MAIDGCVFTFQQLAQEVLPNDMKRMRAAIAAPMRMELVTGGRRAVLNHFGRPKDFSGCYVLVEKGQPFYVGISRKVVSRLTQHVKGKTHSDASLAYAMACHCCEHSMRRAKAMADKVFLAAFEQERTRIRNMDVAVIEIDNPVELYLFEVYAALELRTATHNTFRTH
jgi:predicted GIY-YIG superfamily endonuclease